MENNSDEEDDFEFDEDDDDDFEFSDEEDNEKNIDINEKLKQDSDEDTDDEDIYNNENYNSLQEYKIKHSNNDKKELLQTFFEKKYNKVCQFDRRPSVLTKPYIDILQKKNNKI